jgi:hypothetical protein
MQEIIKENKDFILSIEKISGKWWLELRELKTGFCWVLFCDTKKIALNAYCDAYCDKNNNLLSFEEIQKLIEKIGVPKNKVYKAR